jgi:Rieske Fe-S protein
MSDVRPDRPVDCTDDCELDTGRRAFLKEGLMAVAALTAIAGAAAPLEAMARTYATGRASGDTLTYPVPTADGATIDAANKVVLVRFEGAIAAFALGCPHKGTAVEWQPENARFYCPKHKSTFKPEGTLIQGKAERNMDRYAVRLEGGSVIVDRGTLIKSSGDPAAWGGAAARIA